MTKYGKQTKNTCLLRQSNAKYISCESLQVNGMNLECVTHIKAVNSFLHAGDQVRMRVVPGAYQKLKVSHGQKSETHTFVAKFQ